MNDEAWIVPDWPAPPTVRAVVTTRHGPGLSQGPHARFNLGMNGGDEAAAVAANRAALQRALALPQAPCWLRQVHGCAVVRPRPGAAAPVADAAVSDRHDTVLAILTADCLPVLLCRDDGRAVAAAHAGWRGLAAGVLEATVAALGSDPSRLLAWLGPCIGAASYEVDAPVREAFLAADAAAAKAFSTGRPGHWQCDLAALARQRLARAGVTRVHGGGFDTFADPGLYSYRRDGAASGRFASLIWLQQG